MWMDWQTEPPHISIIYILSEHDYWASCVKIMDKIHTVGNMNDQLLWYVYIPDVQSISYHWLLIL